MKKIFAIALLLTTIILGTSCSKEESLPGENPTGHQLTEQEMLLGTWTVNVEKSKIKGKSYNSLGFHFFQITFFDDGTIQEHYSVYSDTATWTSTYTFTDNQISYGELVYDIRRFDERNLVMWDPNKESYIVSFRRDR